MIIWIHTIDLILFNKKWILWAVFNFLYNFKTQRWQVWGSFLAQRSYFYRWDQCEYVLDIGDLFAPELGPKVFVICFDTLLIYEKKNFQQINHEENWNDSTTWLLVVNSITAFRYFNFESWLPILWFRKYRQLQSKSNLLNKSFKEAIEEVNIYSFAFHLINTKLYQFEIE